MAAPELVADVGVAQPPPGPPLDLAEDRFPEVHMPGRPRLRMRAPRWNATVSGFCLSASQANSSGRVSPVVGPLGCDSPGLRRLDGHEAAVYEAPARAQRIDCGNRNMLAGSTAALIRRSRG